MPERSEMAARFLAENGWGNAERRTLAGDASMRRYERLSRARGDGSSETAVLMDAPPESGEDVRPFLRIASFLAQQGLSAPRVLADDAARGFLLLEDLGDDLFARVMEREPALERPLYEAATDALVHLHGSEPPAGLPAYDSPRMCDLAALSYEWYLGALSPDAADRVADFKAAFAPLLREHAESAEVLVQRDYHAENLLWLPDRAGVARVGLLDFQDAMAGHPAYDLVSLMQDARRDVGEDIEADMVARSGAARGIDAERVDTAYHLLGVQRNLRILGVFARLCRRDGKRGYVDLIPRVWRYLLRDLRHPVAAPLSRLVLRDFPEPEADRLKTLREACQTVPTP